MENCIFCRIAAGHAPCFKLAENQFAFAFLDIQPAAEGHSLVIPKAHFENVYEIGAADMAGVGELVRQLASAVREVIRPDGMMITQANGPAAGQSVMHFHTHLIPRHEGQRLRMHGDQAGDPKRLAALREQIVGLVEGSSSR